MKSIYYRIGIVLLCIAILSGCGQVEDTTISQTQDQPQESETQTQEAEIKPSQEETPTTSSNQPSVLQTFQEGYNPLLALFMFGQDWGEGDTTSMKSCAAEPDIPCAVAEMDFSGEKPVLHLDFGRTVTINQLNFQFQEANIESISIQSNGTEIYQQAPFVNASDMPLERISYLGGVEADELEISFTLAGEESPKALSLSKLECYSEAPVLQKEPFRIATYLPAGQEEFGSTLPDSIETILNGNTYWDSQGNLETKGFGQSKKALWHTVNPKGELIRNGTAGDTINTPEKRQALAKKLADYCRDNGLKGIDIDWEFPEEDEWGDFSELIVEIHKAFQNDGYQLSLAFYPKDIALSPEAVKSIDFVNVMAYDQFDEYGYHSTYQGAEQAIHYFIQLGFQAEQLCLGIPLYGRPTDQAASWHLLKDSGFEDTFANSKNNIFYNNKTLIMDKAAYAQSIQCAGIFLYHAYGDWAEDSVTEMLVDFSEKL